MNESRKSTIKRKARLLFLWLAFAVSAYAQGSSKHVVGETVAQFAAKVGVDMNACHKKMKLHTFTCRALNNAEHGYRVTIEKEGEWSAVLDGGKLVFYDDNLKLPSASPSSAAGGRPFQMLSAYEDLGRVAQPLRRFCSSGWPLFEGAEVLTSLALIEQAKESIQFIDKKNRTLANTARMRHPNFKII